MMPLVSIIIPVYNAEKYLATCFKSIYNQTYPNIELIVINDCSTDNTLNIISEFKRLVPSMRIINNSSRLQPGGSRNAGLNIANGDYIYFMDADDYIHPQAIEILVNLALRYNTPLVEANHKRTIFDKKTKRIDNPIYCFDTLTRDKESLKSFYGAAWNKLLSQDLIDGFRFPENSHYEDIAFIYPVITKADEYVRCFENLYFYRRNFRSITMQSRFFPDSSILDVYPNLDSIKDTCISIGTYDGYKDVINEIIKEGAINPLLECANWQSIRLEDSRELLANLYNYIRSKYGITDITSVGTFKDKHNILFNIRFQNLLWQLSLLPEPKYEDTTSLDNAKRVLQKYDKNASNK